MPERLEIKPGKYRNHLGAEIELIRFYGDPLGMQGELPTIGAIYVAIGSLGQRYSLVTREGLEDAGYQRAGVEVPDA